MICDAAPGSPVISGYQQINTRDWVKISLLIRRECYGLKTEREGRAAVGVPGVKGVHCE